jgi:hypothetical protein
MLQNVMPRASFALYNWQEVLRVKTENKTTKPIE